MTDNNVIHSMPKAELHAHLNGSLSDGTIRKLIDLKSSRMTEADVTSFVSKTTIPSGHKRTLDECFQVFGIIHQLTDSTEAIRLAAIDVIKDFTRDNVKYLELRTTPRHVDGSLDHYVDAVLRAIDECKSESVPILVKLLISIDRSKGLELAENIAHLAMVYYRKRPDVVVGLDVSGNMMHSSISTFFPLLSKVRNAGLKLSIHTAEVHNDEETEAILRFKPERIGHGTFIPPLRCNNSLLLELLKEANIPIELCLTSNVICNTVPAYEDHHLKTMMESGIPFCLCTDDKGVFGTTLTDEYHIASRTFNLSVNQLWDVSFKTLEYGFLSESERNELRLHWLQWKTNYLQCSNPV